MYVYALHIVTLDAILMQIFARDLAKMEQLLSRSTVDGYLLTGVPLHIICYVYICFHRIRRLLGVLHWVQLTGGKQN